MPRQEKERVMNRAVSSGVGALGVVDGAVHWRVWVPHAASVELLLINGEERCQHKMNPEESGYFSQTLAAIAEALLFSSEARKYNGFRHVTTSMEHLQPYESVVIGLAQWHSLWEA
jgi:1,4-alpha-glucan branching enzyme